MKKHSIKPGFELIFALSIAAIIGLPPLVFGQTNKSVEIKITNGDTIVNGKNIKDLSPADRKEALKSIDDLGNSLGNPENKTSRHRILIRKHGAKDTTGGEIFLRDGDFEKGFAFKGDTTGNKFFKFKYHGPDGKDSMFVFNYKMNPKQFMLEPRMFDFPDHDFKMSVRGSGFEMMHRRNSQNFSYSNTGPDGISTHIDFSVSDVSAEKAKQIAGTDKTDLELKDVSLSPQFSSGKTLLMFSLPARSQAEVKLMDNQGKVIWSDKALNGNFSKSFPLGLNGVYLLQVKQTGKIALKRILKEE